MSTTFNTASAELSAPSIILTCASVLSVTAATLISLAHGWDYTFAVLGACATSILLASLYWLELPSDRTGDRAAALVVGTLAAALLCVYAFAKIDCSVLPTHGSLVGLTAGFALFVLLPARYVLDRAQAMRNAAGLMLLVLALAPVALETRHPSRQRPNFASRSPLLRIRRRRSRRRLGRIWRLVRGKYGSLTKMVSSSTAMAAASRNAAHST